MPARRGRRRKHNPAQYAGGGSTTGFGPSQVSNLVAHYDAGTLSLANGAAVTTWTDLTGSHDATQSTVGFKPTYVTGVVQGRPVVRFDGTDDVLASTQFAIASHTASMFSVAAISSKAATRGLASFAGITQANRIYSEYHLGSDLMRVGGTGNVGAAIDTHPTPTLGRFYLIAQTFDADLATAESKTWRDGTAGTLAIDSNNASAALGTEVIGLGNNNGTIGQFWFGDIAEVIFYDKALSTSERQAVQTYLGNKYGITVS